MKIKSVTFTNFKRLANQEFTCNSGLNVFVGANNSGKTSILQAMAKIMQHKKYLIPALSETNGRFLSYRMQQNGEWSIGMQIEFPQSVWESILKARSGSLNVESIINNRILLEELANNPLLLQHEFTIISGKSTEARLKVEILPLRFTLSQQEKETLDLIKPTFASIDFLNGYGQFMSFDAHSFVPFKEPFRSRNEIMNEQADIANIRGRLFYLKQSDPDTFREFTEQLKLAFPEIKNVDVHLNTDEGVFEFVLSEDIPVNGHSIEARYDTADVGLGMQNLLVLTANLLLLKPSVALMDEPDAHMHPALVRDFVRILKQLSKQTQFFITTHNLAFIDALAPENLFTVVYRPEEKGSVIRSAAERKDVVEAAEMLGFSVGNSILSGKPKVYVFVEGASDEKYLLHFAKRLGYAKSVNAFNVQFVPMGGKGERSKMLSLVEKLGMSETPLVLVLDRDETSEEEIQILRKDYFGQHPERLHYWSRRQIENYLLVPQAIQRLAQMKMGASTNEIQMQDVLHIDALLQELADKQRDTLLKRYLEQNALEFSIVRTKEVRDFMNEIDGELSSTEYSRELAGKLTGMITKKLMLFGENSASVNARFSEQWNNPEQRLVMCDGRRLLKDLRKEFQVRGLFSSFSDDDIIAYCEPQDIHDDICKLCSQLYKMVITL